MQSDGSLALGLQTVEGFLEGDPFGLGNRALSFSLGRAVEGVEDLTWVAQPGLDFVPDGGLDPIGSYRDSTALARDRSALV
jgi:hypothetical protein